MTRKIAFVLVGVLLPVAGLMAQDSDDYLDAIRERSFPDRLFHISGLIWDCPVTREAVDTLVTGELIRSRLYRSHDDRTEYGMIFLSVDLSCLQRDGGNPIFRLDVYFEYVEKDRAIFWQLGRNYGTYGIGGEDYILDVVDDSVELAITDFIRAHMLE